MAAQSPTSCASASCLPTEAITESGQSHRHLTIDKDALLSADPVVGKRDLILRLSAVIVGASRPPQCAAALPVSFEGRSAMWSSPRRSAVQIAGRRSHGCELQVMLVVRTLSVPVRGVRRFGRRRHGHMADRTGYSHDR
jgi:hypothetical protein